MKLNKLSTSASVPRTLGVVNLGVWFISLMLALALMPLIEVAQCLLFNDQKVQQLFPQEVHVDMFKTGNVTPRKLRAQLVVYTDNGGVRVVFHHWLNRQCQRRTHM